MLPAILTAPACLSEIIVFFSILGLAGRAVKRLAHPGGPVRQRVGFENDVRQ